MMEDASSGRVMQFLVLGFFAPEGAGRNIAVILLDRADDTLYFRFLNDFTAFDEESMILLSLLEVDLRNKASELGGQALFDYLADCASNTLRVVDLRPVVVTNPEETLIALFHEHIMP